MTVSVHYSSATDNWATPRPLFELIARKYGPFDLDVCADESNAKCDRYYTVEQNGLAQPWTGTVWCNPPYGRDIGKWAAKAVEAANCGAKVVMLLPARTDTAWWHDHVWKASEVRFIKGRIYFGNGASSAPFPSALVIYEPRSSWGNYPIARRLEVSAWVLDRYTRGGGGS